MLRLCLAASSCQCSILYSQSCSRAVQAPPNRFFPAGPPIKATPAAELSQEAAAWAAARRAAKMSDLGLLRSSLLGGEQQHTCLTRQPRLERPRMPLPPPPQMLKPLASLPLSLWHAILQQPSPQPSRHFQSGNGSLPRPALRLTTPGPLPSATPT